MLVAVAALTPLGAAGQADRSLLVAAKNHDHGEVQTLIANRARRPPRVRLTARRPSTGRVTGMMSISPSC